MAAKIKIFHLAKTVAWLKFENPLSQKNFQLKCAQIISRIGYMNIFTLLK